MNLTARAALSRVCGYLGACLVLGMGAQYLGVVAYLTAQGSATPGEPAVTAARLRQVVERGDADALLWATVIAAPVFLLVTWLFRRFVDRAPLSGVGFEGRARWSRFFLGWSQVWAGKYTPDAERLQVATNSHSLPRWRVNCPMSNMPEFSESFACHSPATLIGEKFCEVW